MRVVPSVNAVSAVVTAEVCGQTDGGRQISVSEEGRGSSHHRSGSEGRAARLDGDVGLERESPRGAARDAVVGIQGHGDRERGARPARVTSDSEAAGSADGEGAPGDAEEIHCGGCVVGGNGDSEEEEEGGGRDRRRSCWEWVAAAGSTHRALTGARRRAETEVASWRAPAGELNVVEGMRVMSLRPLSSLPSPSADGGGAADGLAA